MHKIIKSPRVTTTLIAALTLFASKEANCQDTLWRHFQDGRAELAGYQLTAPRYGQLRRGEVVLISVTEPFSRSRRVKVDGAHPGDPDRVTVMKLNQLQRFLTGVYPYQLMTSVFIGPRASGEGLMTYKTSFSSQEWCGILYEEALFTEEAATLEVRSYFDGERGERSLRGVRGSEDGLWVSARFAAARYLDRRSSGEEPARAAALALLGGERVRMLGRSRARRLEHQRAATHILSFSLEPLAEPLELPAGRHRALRISWEGGAEGGCALDVERAPPHRLLQWRCASGEAAQRTGSFRSAYWRESSLGDERLRERLRLPGWGG